MPQGKRYRADSEGWDKEKPLLLKDAVAKIKSFKKAKFDQSVNIAVHLGIDPKQADQNWSRPPRRRVRSKPAAMNWSRRSRAAGWISTWQSPART
jgi:hypothetical protein